jgi:hypothetical protein
VLKSRPAEISITFTHTTRGSVRLRGYMLSWQRGVFAGDAYSRSSYSNGFYAWRTGVADIPGYLSHFGSGCAGSNGRLTQTVSGVPFLGKTSVFSVTWGPTNGAGVWAIGVRTTSFQMPGTSCLLRIDPLLSVPIRYSALGTMQTKVAMPNNRSLIGSGFYSQFAAFDKQANKGGLTTSNGAYLRVGGWK